MGFENWPPYRVSSTNRETCPSCGWTTEATIDFMDCLPGTMWSLPASLERWATIQVAQPRRPPFRSVLKSVQRAVEHAHASPCENHISRAIRSCRSSEQTPGTRRPFADAIDSQE